jgi:hypothetical protein
VYTRRGGRGDGIARERSTLCYVLNVNGKELAERAARAAHRRSTWEGGVAKLGDMDAVDDEFWGAMLPADRFIAVWEASREQYGIDTEASGGLRGSVGGVRRLERRQTKPKSMGRGAPLALL